jgi:hypothetical protein
MMASCGEKNKNVPFEELNVGVAERDTMIYGFCASGSAMNTLQIITDGGDTLTLSVVEARNKNQVFGGYALGDEIAVTVNSDTTEAIMVVNKSTLNGDWVMPNPIDGSSYQGISIMKGGTAESIDQSNITYKSWMLFNGRLLIVASRDDGPGKDETLQFKILRLTTDSLFLSDGDDIYEYARPVVEPEIDLGIELDDGMDDFFL